MNVTSPSVPSAGLESGRPIRQYNPNSLQPSMRAASSKSLGMVAPMYCRIKKIPKAFAALGNQSAMGRSSQ